MKKKIFLTLSAGLFCYSALQAQSTSSPNRLSAGVDYVSLASVPDPGLGYRVGYAKNLAAGRFMVGGNLGYISAPGVVGSYGEYRSEGRKSERFTADLTLSYDLLNQERQALRLGVGPSVWYRKDDEFRGYDVIIESIELGTVKGVNFERKQVNEPNFGFHLTGEYEYLVTQRIALAGRAGFTHFFKTGFNPMAGVSLGYRF